MNPFDYTIAPSVDAAVAALGALLGAAGRPPKVLAGGTTLVDLMRLNVEQPAAIVDINRIPGLSQIDTGQPDELVFGALARMSDVADDPVVRGDYPVLSESLWRAASQQLRNMASLGGNLLQRTRCAYFRDRQYPCNKREPGTGCSALGGLNRGHAVLGASDQCIAVYPGDLAIALVALDASIDVRGASGARTLKVADLHHEPGQTPDRETELAPDELILRIRVPKSRLGKASTYLKIRDRESYAFAIASAAVALDMDGDVVRDARIAVGGLATRPWRVQAAEQSLVGKPFTDAAAAHAGRLALQGAVTRPQNAFRVELGANTVAQALKTARERA
jgi:xanthine dehydrogenase YagS FAD-binding subunit